MRAHFHVIHIASARISSRVTAGWYRIPPLAGPRVMLWTTRKPSNTDTVPSSIATGIDTSTVFLHSPRTRTRFGSTPNVSPTRVSCERASSYGFSRRWVGVSVALIGCFAAGARGGGVWGGWGGGGGGLTLVGGPPPTGVPTIR